MSRWKRRRPPSNSKPSTPRTSRSTARSGAPRQGADRQLDSALHRPDQPHGSDAGPGRHRQLHQCRQGAARRAARLSQRLRLLQRLGAPDRGGDEHRADDRSAGRPRDPQGSREDARNPGELDSQYPRRTGTRRIPADRLHAVTGSTAQTAGLPPSSHFQHWDPATAAITKATPPATSWNRPSTIT